MNSWKHTPLVTSVSNCFDGPIVIDPGVYDHLSESELEQQILGPFRKAVESTNESFSSLHLFENAEGLQVYIIAGLIHPLTNILFEFRDGIQFGVDDTLNCYSVIVGKVPGKAIQDF